MVSSQPLERPRVPASSLECEFPSVPPFQGEDKINAPSVAAGFVQRFSSAVGSQDWTRFAALFADNCWWKDNLALTFDKRTLKGKRAIIAAWKELSSSRSLSDLALEQGGSWNLSPTFTRLGPTLASLDVPFTFSMQNPSLRCIGIAKLIREDEDWKIWILTTAADHLQSHPFQPLPRESPSIVDPSQRGKPAAQGFPHVEGVLDAVVVGGSGAGMMQTIMLESIGANIVCVDKEPVAGGFWANKRYESFQLHHPKFMVQLPKFPVPGEFQEYMSGKDLGRYFSLAVQELNLPFFAGLNVLCNIWNKETKLWKIIIEDVVSGAKKTLNTRNIVLATGLVVGAANPSYPEMLNQNLFPGPIKHTHEYYNAEPYKDRDVVIIGAGNSAHDVAKDLVLHGASSVTILQRSPIVFLSFEFIGPIMSRMWQGFMPVDTADLVASSLPTAVARDMMKPALAAACQAMGDRNEALEKRGYKLNKTPDVISSAYDHAGRNFFMDQPGVLDLILEDKIKVMQGDATGYTEEGVVIQNEHGESVIRADGVVLATGYKYIDLPKQYAESGFVDAESASKLENVFKPSVDAEGEWPGFVTRSGHDHLFFPAPGFYMGRTSARFVAIQVMADVDGPLPERYSS